MIQIEELTKFYGGRKAVGPLTFEIASGEVIGLLGLNGAGKTTTLRMLATDLLPTSGQMKIDGIDLIEEPERLRAQIGYLPDRPPLYGEMTVREFLAFAARLRGVARAKVDKRVEEVVEITSLEDYVDEPIDTLSHGYRQRVGIAQAIVHEPKLLLLDEPISGLDPVQIVEMRQLIRSLRGKHTIVVSSHILSEISETSDRLLVIKDGVIIQRGTESELSTSVRLVKSFVVTARISPAEGGAYRNMSPFARLKRLLAGIDGVRSVQDAPNGDLRDSVVSAQIESDEDVRERVCQVLVEAGHGVLGLERGGRDLEDVFLKLTQAGEEHD